MQRARRLTSRLRLWSTAINVMQLIRANANRLDMKCGVVSIPAIRISGDNARGKMSLT